MPTATQAALRRVVRSRRGLAAGRGSGCVGFLVGGVRSLLGGMGPVVKVGPVLGASSFGSPGHLVARFARFMRWRSRSRRWR